MKSSMLFWIVITSALLLFNAVISQLGISFVLLLNLTAIGSILVIVMVYKVLTADITVDQNFDDWFEEKFVQGTSKKD